MVTRIPAVQPRIRGSFPGKRKRFLFSPAIVVTHLQTRWVPKVLPPWIKLSGCASEHSSSNIRMTNEWRYIISLLSVIHTIYTIMQTKIQGIPERTIYILNKTWTSSKIGPEDDHRRSKHVKCPCILVCIILYMVCMTDNKLIICGNRNRPGWQMWKKKISGGIPSLTPYTFMPYTVTSLSLPMTSPELLRLQPCPSHTACTCSDERYGTVSYVRVPICNVCIRALMF